MIEAQQTTILQQQKAVIEAQQITNLQQQTVERWHTHDIENNEHGFLWLVCEQHRFNYLLWHEEDIARSPDVTEARIAAVKRAIDGYNQQRNDAIEKIDDFLVRELEGCGIQPGPNARQNSETPGSVIDKLSILALRIYHMEEQAHRADASQQHREKAQQKLGILYVQHQDLAAALDELLVDIFAGRKRLKVYRQFKMYNDPALNPYLYRSRQASPSDGSLPSAA